VRVALSLAAVLALLARGAPARAEGPDPAPALVAGAAVLLVGFTMGATLVATAEGRNAPENTGWLVMESGMTLAPLTAHALTGAWARGLAFTALPAATEGGTLALFESDPGTIIHGSLPEQRVMWALFGVGLASSLVGVADVAWSRPRVGPIAVAPALGRDRVGLQLEGTL
jgi:hypothetical protein